MTRIPKRLTPHTVLVEPYRGETWGGPKEYGPAQRIDDVQVVDQVIQVGGDKTRNGTDGSIEETSTAQVGGNASPTDLLWHIGDRVTLWPGLPSERTETILRHTFEPQTGPIPPQQIAYLS